MGISLPRLSPIAGRVARRVRLADDQLGSDRTASIIVSEVDLIVTDGVSAGAYEVVEIILCKIGTAEFIVCGDAARQAWSRNDRRNAGYYVARNC